MARMRELLAVYGRPRVLAMLGLGFSAGLPFLLVFSTLTAWLKDADIERSTIGLFGWIGITYSIKVAWAPVIDRAALPGFGLLGRRRGWMLAAQLGIAGGLYVLSTLDPHQHLGLLAWTCLGVAFASATQDVVVDAWRIEAEDAEYQGAMAAAYVYAYRVAMLAAGAGALWLADVRDWGAAYRWMALLGLVGVVTTLLIPEPDVPPPEPLPGETRGERIAHWFRLAVWEPLRGFVVRHAWRARAILLLVALFKVSDVVMAGMANPFLLELGYSKTEIAAIAKGLGFAATLAGAGVGGLAVAAWGVRLPLVFGALGVGATTLVYAALAAVGNAGLIGLSVAMTMDSLAGGFASAVFVAWLSSLTDPRHTATQYALLSSLMTLPAKFLAGFAGVAATALGWVGFFVLCAALGLPALGLAALIVLYGEDPRHR